MTYRGDLYRGDLYRGDFYRGDFYRGDLYRRDLYRGDLYRGYLYSGDLYSCRSNNNHIEENDLFRTDSTKPHPINRTLLCTLLTNYP